MRALFQKFNMLTIHKIQNRNCLDKVIITNSIGRLNLFMDGRKKIF